MYELLQELIYMFELWRALQASYTASQLPSLHYACWLTFAGPHHEAFEAEHDFSFGRRRWGPPFKARLGLTS